MHYAPICLPNCKINRINLFERANSVQFRMFFLSVRRQSHTKSAVCYLLRGRFYWLVWLGNSAEAHSSRYDTQNENEPRKKTHNRKIHFMFFVVCYGCCCTVWILICSSSRSSLIQRNSCVVRSFERSVFVDFGWRSVLFVGSVLFVRWAVCFFHFTSSYRSNRCACVSLLYCGTYAQAKPNLILSTLCFGFGCVVYIIYSAMVLCVYTLRVRSVRFGVRLLSQHENEAGRQQLICFAAAAAAVLTTHSHNETVRQSYVRSPCIILQMDWSWMERRN